MHPLLFALLLSASAPILTTAALSLEYYSTQCRPSVHPFVRPTQLRKAHAFSPEMKRKKSIVVVRVHDCGSPIRIFNLRYMHGCIVVPKYGHGSLSIIHLNLSVTHAHTNNNNTKNERNSRIFRNGF